MAIPQQIQQQSKDVQDLHASIYNDAEQGEPNDSGANGQQTQPQPDAGGAPNDDTDYQQKWRSLQGMFNAANSELSQAKSENSELLSRVNSLEHLLSQLQTQPPAQQQPVDTKPLVTEKDIEDYGEDVISLARRVSQEEMRAASGEIARLQAEINQLRGVVPDVQQVRENQQRTSDQMFWSEINAHIPNWSEINDSPEFKNWLREIDPLSGLTRQVYLEDAQRKADAGRVIQFFRMWESVSGGKSQASPNPSSQLNSQIAPGRSKGSAPQQGNEGERRFTRSQIEQFYNDVAKGAYKGKEKERAETERDIFNATNKGLIDAG